MISPAGVTVTPIVTKNHPLALFSTDDAATTYSGGASNQDARSAKSRITVATTGTTSKASASCEHPLRKQQPGALLSTSQFRKQTNPLVLLSLLETMFKTQTLVESIQWEGPSWLKIL
jgi:hypothetical protein